MKNFILYKIYEGYKQNITNFLKIQNSIFPQKYTRCGNNFTAKIIYFKKIYKFSAKHLFRHAFFVLIVKKRYQK